MEWISPVLSAIVAVVAVAGLVYSHLKELRTLEARVKELETKIEPFWEFVKKTIPEMLIGSKGNPEPLTRRDELLFKFKMGTIAPHEMPELVKILEAEKEQAEKDKNLALLIALGLLLAALAAPSKK